MSNFNNVINNLIKKYSNLPNCKEYTTFFNKDPRYSSIRFITNGEFDLCVFYFNNLDGKNYDLFIINKKIGDFFLREPDPNKKEELSKYSLKYKKFQDIKDKIEEFLMQSEKTTEKNIVESVILSKKQIFEIFDSNTKKVRDFDRINWQNIFNKLKTKRLAPTDLTSDELDILISLDAVFVTKNGEYTLKNSKWTITDFIDKFRNPWNFNNMFLK